MEKAAGWLSSFRELEEKKGRTLAIVSGKGGVGKTTYSLRLAHDLGRRGKRVLVLDCDYNLSNTAIKLNISLKNNFIAFLKNEKLLNDCIIRLSTFDLLPTASGELDIFDSKFQIQNIIINMIDGLQKYYDYIILDSPAGIQKETLNLASYCDDRFIICTPDKSSITDAYSLYKILINRYGGNSYFIANRCKEESSYRRLKKSIQSTSRSFLQCEAVFLGFIPEFNFNTINSETDFIFGENNAIEEKSYKIISNYLEKNDERDQRSNISLLRDRLDQLEDQSLQGVY